MVSVKIKTMDRGSLEQIKAKLEAYAAADVLIGVPDDTNNARQETQAITNAQIAYIQSNGSELHNLPPRPFLQPSIESEPNRQLIADEMKEALKGSLDMNEAEVNLHLEQAGMLGQNAARGWFTDPRNAWPVLSPVTLARRKAKRRKIGAETSESDGIERPLIDTAQLIKSIVYVVRGPNHV